MGKKAKHIDIGTFEIDPKSIEKELRVEIAESYDNPKSVYYKLSIDAKKANLVKIEQKIKDIQQYKKQCDPRYGEETKKRKDTYNYNGYEISVEYYKKEDEKGNNVKSVTMKKGNEVVVLSSETDKLHDTSSVRTQIAAQLTYSNNARYDSEEIMRNAVREINNANSYANVEAKRTYEAQLSRRGNLRELLTEHRTTSKEIIALEAQYKETPKTLKTKEEVSKAESELPNDAVSRQVIKHMFEQKMLRG